MKLWVHTDLEWYIGAGTSEIPAQKGAYLERGKESVRQCFP